MSNIIKFLFFFFFLHFYLFIFKVNSIDKYRGEVEKELGKICDELQTLISTILLPNAKSVESKAFYYKVRQL